MLDAFFRSSDPDALEAELPEYVPFLGGSRYSLKRLRAGLDGLTLAILGQVGQSGRLPGSGHVPSGVTQEAIP